MPTRTDDFAGTGALSANWTAQRGTLTRSSGAAIGTVGGDWNNNYWSGDAWGNDQYSEVVLDSGTLPSTGSFPSLLIMVRVTGTATHEVFYMLGLIANGSNIDITLYRKADGAGNYNATVIAALATSVAYAAGDTFRLTVSGTTLTATQNGSTIGSPQTDANIASGSPGIGTLGNSAGDGIASWAGSDGAGGASSWGAQLSDLHNRLVVGN